MSNSKYTTLSQLNLPEIEQIITAQWQANDTFNKSITERDGQPSFVFYEGPPSANGLPGIHHVISRTIKDLFCRYKTMQGFQVQRKAGWDTHGLPVELGVEKELGITKEDIGTKISVEDYNKACKEIVMRYQDKWSSITEKMGYWVNLNDPYVTYHNEYIETLWWCLKELHTKKLLYKSVSIQPYSPAAGTGLSSHELNQPGCYKEVKDTSATVLFQLEDNNVVKNEGLPVHVMAWTTTPWTLPSNLGLTVGPKINYVQIETINPYTFTKQQVILAEALIGKYFDANAENLPIVLSEDIKAPKPWRKIAQYTGAQLEGLRYQQILPFESNKKELIEGDPFRIVCGDFVTTVDGTGIVHTAPAFGADDYRVGQKNNLGILTLVDRRGKFIAGTSDGVFVLEEEYVKEEYLNATEIENAFKEQKEILERNGKIKELKKYLSVNDRLVLKLQEEHKLFKKEKYEHSYPHCWRTDKPIIYYPLDAWFIKTTAAKDRMVELNNTIQWKPKSTGEGRFGNWLENMVDWNLSRSRFWGTPLPIWRTEDGEQEICIGNTQELVDALQSANSLLAGNKDYASYISANQKFIDAFNKGEQDLHKPYIDEVYLATANGEVMFREADLIDVWFDSGAMPYAQWGVKYAEQLKAGDASAKALYPAGFIAEGVDQTRGWFYTLHALAVMLFDSVAYKAVISNGLVLDKNGNKMSKRLGNVVDPFETINKYSADATRWYLVTNASPWDSVKFDENGITEARNKFFGTLYNTYSFFALYANVDGFTYKESNIPLADRPEIDRWVISQLNSLITLVTESFNDYEPTKAARAIQEFVDEHLSNWHVRLSRKRFWRGEYEQDKIAAYQTLYECLITVAKLMAPVAPFFADWLYNNLNNITKKENHNSVHLATYPITNTDTIDSELEDRMRLAQTTSSLILSIRKKEKIKVRQPLGKAMIPVLDMHMQTQLEAVADLIKAETNIKTIAYITEADSVINKKIKPNFKTLGAKLGSLMKPAADIIKNWGQTEIATIEKNHSKSILIDGQEVIITLEEVDIMADDIPGWSVASKDEVTVALDLTIDETLKQEGIARELINRLQNLRKDSGLDVVDRIIIQLVHNKNIEAAVKQFEDYIKAEVLANTIEWKDAIASSLTEDINGYEVEMSITKA
jgi:isoleucyl-tRNA synthetase